VERAKIILCSAEGKTTHQIAKELGTRPSRVSKWRKRFGKLRVRGLEDEQRSGRKVINDESVERRILDQLAKAPPQGFARWNGRLVAAALGNVSDDAVWRVMRKHDLHLDRRQSWCVSTDPKFSSKASDIVGLYLNPSENAIVLCVDEKPGIQALVWSGLKVASGLFRALLMNTKDMAQPRSLPL
jgi:transposase